MSFSPLYKLFWFVVQSAIGSAEIIDLGTFGCIFPIKEKHIIEVLKAKMSSSEGQQLWSDLEDKLKRLVATKDYRPSAGVTLTPAPKHISILFDPSVALKQDLTDHNGNRFYQAGDSINPLKHMTLSKAYVLIDGDKSDQVAFAKDMQKSLQTQQNTMIILVKGDPLKLMREHNIKVFFDQEGVMTKRFQLQHIPCLLEQEGQMLRLTAWTAAELQEKLKTSHEVPS